MNILDAIHTTAPLVFDGNINKDTEQQWVQSKRDKLNYEKMWDAGVLAFVVGGTLFLFICVKIRFG